MLLAIDVGNTQTHIGAFDGAELVEHWRFGTDAEATADELAIRVSSVLRLRELTLDGIDGSIVSSVVPELTPEYGGMASRYLEARYISVVPGIKTGIAIRMDNPHELGADRLVNAVAAYDRFGGPCAVVDFGTAITFDAISGEGEYLGGVIGPGVRVSMEALTERAARLPKVELAEPAGVIGKTTQASMQSGMIYGFAGAIDSIARRLVVELGEETRFIATGGGAEVIVPHCEMVDEIDDLLTLTGLRLVWELNA
ncbi:MAG: type III pantothenate kinase [Actinomycetota bacterium]|nr:type III pantothenate kinase [Actinomycetota bacterium]